MADRLEILQQFENLLTSKLELTRQVQSLVDTSAQSLDAFRLHCSTSRELIKDEIRMLEGKLVQRIGRQLAIRKALKKHFAQISADLHLSQCLETDLDMFVAQRERGDGKPRGSISGTFSTASDLELTIVDHIKLSLHEEFSRHPRLDQWLEIVGLQPVCIKAVMDLVGDVEELLTTSESKLKAVIVQASVGCSCPRPSPTISDMIPIEDASQIVPDSALEDSSKDSGGLKVDAAGSLKEKGKLPFHVREDVRRLITACRLLRVYSERILTDDNELKELFNLNPMLVPYANAPPAPGSTTVNGSSTSSSATPPNNLVRKESVKSLYWDSWRTRPVPGMQTPGQPGSFSVPSGYCAVHSDRKYQQALGRDQRVPSMLSSFSSEDNYLAQHRPAACNQIPTRGTTRLTSQSSVISSVSTATTTGDEGDVGSMYAEGSMYADLPSVSSSCANSVFPSSNNLLQLVQQYESSPGTLRRLNLTTQDARSGFSSLNTDTSPNIRSSCSTPSLLLAGNTLKPTLPVVQQASLSPRKELVKFTKSTSLESSLRNRLSSDEGVLPLGVLPLGGQSVLASPETPTHPESLNSSDNQSSSNERRMHHSIHHVFRHHFSFTLHHCSYCGKSIRGAGRKCRHCKFRCHPECALKAPPDCGLPDGLVQEYYKSKSHDKFADTTETQVEEDDETLQPYSTEYRRRQSELAELRDYEKQQEWRYSPSNTKSPEPSTPKSTWRPTFKLFSSKLPSPPPAVTTPNSHPKARKQRSRSFGNVLEGTSETKFIGMPVSPSAEIRSPITRRISGSSFSLPRDHRKRRPTVSPKENDDTHPKKKPVPMRETRIFSDPSIKPRSDDKKRTASSSSGLDPQSPAHTSMDSLSAPSSSYGSSGPSVPPSPGTFSRSGSSGPPMSPLAVSSFANPGRTYRSFMRTMKDQFKSHFHWPIPRDDSNHSITGAQRTPLFQRRKSKSGDSMHGERGGNTEDEVERSEALDSFPAVMPRSFPTVLVAGGDKADGRQTASRRYSLLEPQEDIEVSVEKVAIPKMQVDPPAVEIEEDNEPSFSNENSDPMAEPIPWRRQQSLYLRELSIPYKDLVFGDKLGQGTFGQVYRGKWHGDVAIKVLNSDYLYEDVEELHEAFKLDLANLRKTRHDNLVLFMGACTRTEDKQLQQIIITALLSRGLPVGAGAGGSQSITRHDLIHDSRSKSLSAPYKAQLNRLLIIATQVCQGMGYLHRRGIVHKDLKSQNIFVTHEKCFITDYGLFSVSKMFQHGRSDDLLWFPKNWLAYLSPEICRHLQTPRQQKAAFTASRDLPELHSPVPFTIYSDVYAFGTILHELCTGAFPLLFSVNNAQRLHQMHALGGLMTPGVGGLDTPLTPSAPATPVMSLPGRPGVRPPDPNLPGSLESALYLIGLGEHPIYRMFRSRNVRKLQINAPQQIDPLTPPTPAMRSAHTLLSPSLEEAAAKDLADLISVCWSPKMSSRKEFPEISMLLEKVPKKVLARSPSHPVHGNASFPKDSIYY